MAKKYNTPRGGVTVDRDEEKEVVATIMSVGGNAFTKEMDELSCPTRYPTNAQKAMTAVEQEVDDEVDGFEEDLDQLIGEIADNFEGK